MEGVFAGNFWGGNTGYLTVSLMIMFAIGYLGVIVCAFKENILYGIACIAFPISILLFVLFYLEKVWFFIFMMLIPIVMGFIILLFGPFSF